MSEQQMVGIYFNLHLHTSQQTLPKFRNASSEMALALNNALVRSSSIVFTPGFLQIKNN